MSNASTYGCSKCGVVHPVRCKRCGKVHVGGERDPLATDRATGSADRPYATETDRSVPLQYTSPGMGSASVPLDYTNAGMNSMQMPADQSPRVQRSTSRAVQLMSTRTRFRFPPR